MQRQVISTKFTYVVNEIHEDGTISSRIDTVKVPNEKDEKRAYKKASKMVGNFAPIKCELISNLWKCDDDEFFKIAECGEDMPYIPTENEGKGE